MRYRNVCLESFGYVLPERVVTSAEIESRLRPLYERLRLPEGRLELMTGIRQRRFWPPGTLPSEKSVVSAQRALAAAGLDRREIGALIHASVCAIFWSRPRPAVCITAWDCRVIAWYTTFPTPVWESSTGCCRPPT